MIAPFAFLISSSLKVETQVFQYPIQWIPNPVRWMNYVDALTQKPFFLYFKNTMVIAIFNQIAILLTASLVRLWLCPDRFPRSKLLVWRCPGNDDAALLRDDGAPIYSF